MTTTLHLLAALLWLQEQEPPSAPAPESAVNQLSGRRSSISLESLLPAGSGGSASHKETGSTAVELDYPITRAEPSVNVSLALDLGPFDSPVHTFLTLHLNRIGIATEQPGTTVFKPSKGEWRSIEVLIGVDWLSEQRTRVGGGLSFGVQTVAYTLIEPVIHDADVSATVASVGLQFYVEQPLGSGFRIGSGIGAALIPNTSGGAFAIDDEETHGHTFSLAAWVAWEPLRGLSLRAGYGVWTGQFDHERTPFLSTSTATDRLDLHVHGPLFGIEWAF